MRITIEKNDKVYRKTTKIYIDTKHIGMISMERDREIGIACFVDTISIEPLGNGKAFNLNFEKSSCEDTYCLDFYNLLLEYIDNDSNEKIVIDISK